MNASYQSTSKGPPRISGVRGILLAAGKGTRMKGAVDDKILVPISGKSSFLRSYESFREANLFDGFVVVYRDAEQRVLLEAELGKTEQTSYSVPVEWAKGGSLRQDSVFEGLVLAGQDSEYVFIHDCARPLVRPADLRRLYERVVKDKAAALARPVTDTIKRVDRRRKNSRKCILRDIDRRGCWSMETPQAFEYTLIFDAYQKARQKNHLFTDDTSIAAADGAKVTLVEPGFPNPKITRPGDLSLAAFLIENPNFIQEDPS